MQSRNQTSSSRSDVDLMLAVERARRRNRGSSRKRDRWERELWSAYLLDGPGRLGPAANDPPADIA